jgi:25S rRNA (uracil2843-N3)-methyltransferase
MPARDRPARTAINPAAKYRQKRAENEPKKTYAPKSAPRGHITAEAVVVKISRLPFELQQLVLNLFKDCFQERFGDDLDGLVQEIKGHLFKREFESAFCFGPGWVKGLEEGNNEGKDDGDEIEGDGEKKSVRWEKEEEEAAEEDEDGEDAEDEVVRVRDKSEYLEGYAVRWSPARALGYMEILYEIVESIVKSKEVGETGTRDISVACLGGGAGAEIASFAGVLNFLLGEQKEERGEGDIKMTVDLVDIADWGHVTEKLHKGLTTGPPISKYASAAVKAANVSLVPADAFETTFHQKDVLSLSPSELSTLLSSKDLITLFFTLNELYTTSLPSTQSFLANLTAITAPGTLLLVIDSAGSYSTVKLQGKGEKRYPMHWLLDHTLLDEREGAQWKKEKEESSRWYRIPEGLQYKLELENMRVQVHLYRRL